MAPIWSIIANRKDKANQQFWTEYRANIVSGCPAQPGDIVMLGPNGTIDPCLLPSTTGLLIEVSGVPVDNQNILNFIPGTGITIVSDPSGGLTISASGTPGECGSAAFLCTDDVGTEIAVDISHPTHAGQILISQPGNTSAAWADPFVQGNWVDGTPVVAPGPIGDGVSNIQPVLVAGKGTSPSGQDGKMHSLPLTAHGEALFTAENPQINANSGGTDPYERDRVSTPITLWEQSYEFFPVGTVTSPTGGTQFTFLTTGSGAFNRPALFAQIQGTVGGDSGARAVWQTKTYFISQLGKGFGIFTTGNLGANIANVITRIGAYDDDRGGFFEQNGTLGVLRVVFRANGSDANAFPQSAWNIDKLDGTGLSGITLNMALGQAFTIDIGAGRVRFGFIINGVTYYCHAINVSNAVTAVAHAQSVVPVRFEILNAAASAGGTVSQSNIAVISDGGYEDDPSAFAFSVNTGASLRSITAATPIISIRPKLTVNGHSNRIFITLRDFSTFSLGQIFQYQLVYNGTLTTPTFNDADPLSAVEFDTSAASVTGGRVVDSGYIAAFAKDTSYSADLFPFRLPFTLDITGTIQDVYTLVVTPMSASAQVGGSFKWQEQR